MSLPPDIDRLYHLAFQQRARGDLVQAEGTLRRILDLAPSHPEARAMLDEIVPQLMSLAPGSAEGTGTWIERMGNNWPILGWVLFAMWLVPGLFGNAAILFFLIGFVLWHTWLVIDMVDQKPRLWQVAATWVLLLLAFLPLGGSLRIAGWVIYFLRFRE